MIDVFDPRVFARGVPHDALRELRDHDPVAWQDEHEVGIWPAGPGFWAVTRHADVRHVLRSPQDFSSSLGATQIRDPDRLQMRAFFAEFLALPPATLDGPPRRLVSNFINGTTSLPVRW